MGKYENEYTNILNSYLNNVADFLILLYELDKDKVVLNMAFEAIKLNMDKILELKNLGVDLFNIKDDFFNDICRPYSDNETDSDMILSDRVNDLFQNFSVCGDGCEYNSFNETKARFITGSLSTMNIS